jgi:hypothetical protein
MRYLRVNSKFRMLLRKQAYKLMAEFGFAILFCSNSDPWLVILYLSNISLSYFITNLLAWLLYHNAKTLTRDLDMKCKT